MPMVKVSNETLRVLDRIRGETHEKYDALIKRLAENLLKERGHT